MPTLAGWGVLVSGGLLVSAGYVFGAREFLVAGIAAVAATCGATALRWIRSSRVVAARHVRPPRIAAGESARVDLVVVNCSRFRSPLLRLHEAVGNTSGVDLSMASLQADGGRCRGAYRLPSARRGVIELGPIRIDDLDALGLAQRSHRIDSRERLIVHPPIEHLPAVATPARNDPLYGHEHRSLLGLRDEEFDGLRTYVPGDDPRRIHWRTSARVDELQVRQFSPSRQGQLCVVIDTRSPGDETATLDVTTSIAASIADAALRAGDIVGITTSDNRRTPMVSGAGQLDVILEFLALLEGGSDRVHFSVPERGGTVIAISADTRMVADDTLRLAFANRLRAAVTVTVDTTLWASPGGVPNRVNDWIHLTGPGQLGSVWSSHGDINTHPESATVSLGSAS